MNTNSCRTYLPLIFGLSITLIIIVSLYHQGETWNYHSLCQTKSIVINELFFLSISTKDMGSGCGYLCTESTPCNYLITTNQMGSCCTSFECRRGERNAFIINETSTAISLDMYIENETLSLTIKKDIQDFYRKYNNYTGECWTKTAEITVENPQSISEDLYISVIVIIPFIIIFCCMCMFFRNPTKPMVIS